jgi:hypothetical protein
MRDYLIEALVQFLVGKLGVSFEGFGLWWTIAILLVVTVTRECVRRYMARSPAESPPEQP